MIRACAMCALLVAGCAKREQASVSTSPPASATGSAAAPCGVSAPYTEDLGASPTIAAIYRELRKRGASPADLDRGCTVFRHRANGTTETPVEGECDHRITACEVTDYVLERSDVPPELV